MDAGSIGISSIYIAAFVLGAMHSLEPGHGKTVVAAYLVGSKGRNLDALILGLVVTFTHSFSIILLGAIAKLSSRYFTDQQLHASLGIAASLIILGIGLWMLKTRWTALKSPSNVHHHKHIFHSHSHTHHHAEYAHEHNSDGHNHDHEDNDKSNPPIPPFPHPGGFAESKERGGKGGFSCNDKPLGLWGLILLGISGGIVPCPAALAILLASASVGAIGKGLALVIIFSIGLAASLVSIGLLVVNGVRFTQRFMDTERFASKIAFLSAVIVTMVGVFTLYSSLRHFRFL